MQSWFYFDTEGNGITLNAITFYMKAVGNALASKVVANYLDT